MSAAGPPLAGGAAAGQTSPGRRGQSPACPGRAHSTVSGPSPRPRPLNTQRLRRRVVTRQQLFFLALASWCATRGRMHKIGG